MGCGYSTPQLQQPQDEAAAGGADHQDRSPNYNNKNDNKLSCLIRRRGDSIRRRRRKRVGDATAITMELETTTADDVSSKHPLNAAASPDDRENIVVEAVCRAIEDVLLSEEREYNAEALQVLKNDDHKSVSSKDMVVKRQMYVPQSPSFRVYCTRVDSFDSHSSSTKFHDDNAVKDVDKTKKHGRPKSMDSAGSSEEGSTSTRSSKSKIEVGEKGEITKKAGSNWKLGSPLGMKNIFVMPSCYSCSPNNNRDRLLSRG